EWRGSKTPVLLFGGRRGQVIGLDLYDNTEGNYNFALGGSSGSGKSVFLNEIAWSYLGAGAKVWMLDLGKSFARLCEKADGQMLELRAGSGLNINPFTHIVDFNDDMAMLQAVVAKAAAPYGALEPFQYAAIATALNRLYDADTLLAGSARRALAAVDELALANPGQFPVDHGASYPNTTFGGQLKQVAQLIKADVGLRVA
ncbi:MAG: hypothetical protein JNK74_29525, partial [Candidatus Hydrogenedentes bacterium]|nr:hypothetical protein [Candidatus Hydrogenedentota bacterium]